MTDHGNNPAALEAAAAALESAAAGLRALASHPDVAVAFTKADPVRSWGRVRDLAGAMRTAVQDLLLVMPEVPVAPAGEEDRPA